MTSKAWIKKLIVEGRLEDVLKFHDECKPTMSSRRFKKLARLELAKANKKVGELNGATR